MEESQRNHEWRSMSGQPGLYHLILTKLLDLLFVIKIQFLIHEDLIW